MSDVTPPSRIKQEPHEWYGPCDGFGPYGECSVCTSRKREFECFFNFLGWWQWSFGVHLDVRHPHLDLHVPFGFLRLGWRHFDRCGPLPARKICFYKATEFNNDF